MSVCVCVCWLIRVQTVVDGPEREREKAIQECVRHIRIDRLGQPTIDAGGGVSRGGGGGAGGSEEIHGEKRSVKIVVWQTVN